MKYTEADLYDGMIVRWSYDYKWHKELQAVELLADGRIYSGYDESKMLKDLNIGTCKIISKRIPLHLISN